VNRQSSATGTLYCSPTDGSIQLASLLALRVVTAPVIGAVVATCRSVDRSM
jgi:hypothetical protein